MSDAVLDASAVIALLQEEPGADIVRATTRDGARFISSVNLSEVVAKLIDRPTTPDGIRGAIASLDLEVQPLDESLAFEAGFLRTATRAAGLSLGDRACLALAIRLRLPVITTDRLWATLGLPVEVIVARPDTVA